MGTILLDAFGGRELRLDSAQFRQLANYQGAVTPPHELNQFSDLERTYGQDIQRRVEPTPRYNCHGLSFGARRTCIESPATVRQVLQEDGYVEVTRDVAGPGDFVLYFSEDGDIEHSGLLLQAPAAQPLGVPLVLSKWGRYAEVVHLANRCPYNFAFAKYFRPRPK